MYALQLPLSPTSYKANIGPKRQRLLQLEGLLWRCGTEALAIPPPVFCARGTVTGQKLSNKHDFGSCIDADLIETMIGSPGILVRIRHALSEEMTLIWHASLRIDGTKHSLS
jgi:hypothetical protein